MAIVFESLYNPGVRISDPFINSKGHARQYLNGKDRGYDWQSDFPVGSPTRGGMFNPLFTFSIPGAVEVNDYVSVSLIDELNPAGKTSKILESRILKYSPDNFNGQYRGTVRVTHKLYNPLDEIIIEQYVKFPQMDEILAPGDWFNVQEWKTRNLGRWSLLIKKDIFGNAFWELRQEKLPSHDIGAVLMDKLTIVPFNEWFNLKTAFKIGDSGYVMVAINNATIFEYIGPTLSVLSDWDFAKVYTSKEVIDRGNPYVWYAGIKIMN